jgi:Terminase large subunit, T4likevirus-type, N-terminal
MARPKKAGPTSGEPVWAPQPGPQLEAITADWCGELFYGGAAGGGKSDLLLGDFLQDVPTYKQHWSGILFRRTYNELEELIRRAREVYPASGGQWHEQSKTWKWPNGAQLRMRYIERDADATRYQGHSYTWIGWDELTQWPSDYGYRFLRGRLRSAYDVPTKRIRAAANPGGVGHHWVKAYFVDPAPGGYIPILDPVTRMQRMFIPARLRDNQILLNSDPGYGDRLRGLASDAMVRAWLEGDWTVVEGAFFDCWRYDKHVVQPFSVPNGWTRFRSMDWGSARPFSVGWWAIVSDDHYLPREGAAMCLPRGALVRYREWYGASGPNVGLKMTAEQVAEGIVERERGSIASCGFKAEPEPNLRYGVLDPSCFREDGGPSIAERINRVLIGAKLRPFHAADNARVPQRGSMGGWDQLRSRLVGQDDRPMIYCFSTHSASIRTIPALQHDADKPEDINTEGEDHAGDEWRYACMSRPWSATPTLKTSVPSIGYRTIRTSKPSDWRVY